MKREHLLALFRVAGYHDDSSTYACLMVENRISKTSADRAWDIGVKARENGVPCICRRCVGERSKAARARAAAAPERPS